MTKRTRVFLMVAAGVLVVGLATGLVASYLGLPALALGGADGPDELRYVPADARVIAYANVRDVMNSELRQKVRQVRPDGERHDEFRESTGIDLENDIDEVVASVTTPGEDAENALVIARGRFDEVRIEGFIRERGGVVSEHHGVRLLTHTPPRSHNRGEMALAFVEPGLVAFGSGPAVRQAIERKSGGENITTNDEVMGLVREIDDGNAWAVGRFDAIASRARLPREVADQLPPINWFSASGHVNGGLRGLLRAEARDEVAAQNLRDVIRGFVALARLQAGTKPELNAIMDSLQLGGEGRTVSLAFSLPSEVIDMLGAFGAPHGDRDDEPPQPPEPPRPPAPPLPPN
ncbi:MAG: hypothetical protein ACRD26_17045 [Vicinamibacterales bacterium]